jgi:LPXTG-motif cell wall-anchored protein
MSSSSGGQHVVGHEPLPTSTQIPPPLPAGALPVDLRMLDGADLDPHEVFIKGYRELADRSDRRARNTILGAAGVLVVIAGVVAYRRRKKAATAN